MEIKNRKLRVTNPFNKKTLALTMATLIAASAAVPALAADDHSTFGLQGAEVIVNTEGTTGTVNTEVTVDSAPPAAPLAPRKSNHAHEWDHAHQAEWGSVSPVCSSGHLQSPINLVAKNTPVDLSPWKGYYSPDGVALNIENNGHTIQVNYPEGNTIVMNGKKWELKQFHFHTPSEYMINGERFPMEVHFVHKDDAGNLFVIGMMMKEGMENKALAKIWDKMPTEPGAPQIYNDVKINAADFFPPEYGTGNAPYFQLMGSLTTPPCSEGVMWIVMKDPIEVSPAQIEKFKASFPDGNSRKLQADRPATLGY